MQNFAAQAVIAIENTRLLSELRQRTSDLTESLEQQTATSEVLKVVSSSPGDLQPVFEAMLANATRLCEAKFGALWLCEGDALRAVALNAPPAFAEERQRQPLILPTPETGLGRAVKTKLTVHSADLLAEEHVAPVLAKLARARTYLAVPMLKDNEVIGAIGIYRQEVRPFTDKQVALVENFAAQAVIAIENTRLLNELRQRTDDLTESLEQQTATANVLRVISSSPGELGPVFDAALDSATRLCEANFGILYRYEGSAFRAIALRGAPPAFAEFQQRAPIHPTPASGLGRIVSTRRPVHIIDAMAEQRYIDGDLYTVTAVQLSGSRTLIFVPMLKDDGLIGAITIYRREVRSFTEKQIELLQNFAAQAVIAIENTRLLNELRQRTDDLSESLEQQTATSQVLGVISSSPGELGPVFNAMLENAVRICEAKFGFMYRYDGDTWEITAVHGAAPAYAEYAHQSKRPGPQTVVARIARTKQMVHITDLAASRGYAERDPLVVTAVEVGGVRTLLGVPMLKENELIGAITIYRQEVRPFTDKQIALVQNFAAQAVIAIENTRLLNELRQRTDDLTELLQQQVATADVLKVISRSTFDLKAVLDTLVEFGSALVRGGHGPDSPPERRRLLCRGKSRLLARIH